MAVAFVAANAAYQAANSMASATQAGATAGATAAAPDGASFANALTDAMKNAVDTIKSGETAAGSGATGQGDVVNMVNAVTSAELTLQSVVAIRDRVISAYQDILKMPI